MLVVTGILAGGKAPTWRYKNDTLFFNSPEIQRNWMILKQNLTDLLKMKQLK